MRFKILNWVKQGNVNFAISAIIVYVFQRIHDEKHHIKAISFLENHDDSAPDTVKQQNIENGISIAL